jgi:hypothetical protein
MRTHAGHLTYCTNIHAGESWADHFASLQAHFPAIKARIAPDRPMGIGLRLSNQASLDLVREDELALFKRWLTENDAYVFTMNGFPYGGFHHTRVKDQVHAPDWTTGDRVAYTLRLFQILEALMPEGERGGGAGVGDGLEGEDGAEVGDGAGAGDGAFPPDAGISTSPLSYRHWFTSPGQLQEARARATLNILSVAEQLIRIHRSSGKLLHLDIEPEPDGLLETGAEFIEWFEADLLPAGRVLLASTFSCTGAEAESLLKEHIRLCYDVCHFAIGYESHREVMRELAGKEIKIGKIQISAALKAMIPGAGPGGAGDDPGAATDDRRAAIRQAFAAFNEPVYLHQVVAKQVDGSLLRYPDLPEALADFDRPTVREWRAHFHVPIFLSDFGSLQSTREDISEVLALQQERPVTQHLEVETYTWEVLPEEMRLPLEESIIRELQWVKDELTTTNE